MDRTKVIGIVAAVVGVIVVVVALKVVGGGGGNPVVDVGGVSAGEGFERSPSDGRAPVSTPGNAAASGAGAGGDAMEEEPDGGDRKGGFVASGGARGVEGDPADFGQDLNILPAEYAAEPLPALDERVRNAAVEVQDGRSVTIHSFGCLDGGRDCKVSGVAETPSDLRKMAERIEQDAAAGDEELPTVEIQQTRGSSSGSTDFQIGVYY